MAISTPSLELLESFLALAESGSVSKAAQILHRSQPAISERLQRLTELAGEPLYYGMGRGVRLTAAGEAYLAPARRLRDPKREWSDMVQRRRQFASRCAWSTTGRIDLESRHRRTLCSCRTVNP
ncbi:LysR family transcriptional regulator [Candidatus Igneacidithiobacillus taiwanensis]|uniref:LysR family transcriptional regulator n=1 Tax=Candidatus Igneacidithiobacillus taiwanensis TaxID=1945924 RepID=UPI00289BCB87|nr:LysR family transcriptional regulator [Candidatus Igneacidithiobacillus taiwanensis]